jgi:hypothetical protein
LVLPPEYADWLAMGDREGVALEPSHRLASLRSAEAEQRILAPVDGDEYEQAPGVDARYATLALSATPDARGRQPAWYVDGRPHREARWRIEPGQHVIRAVWQGGGADSVRVVVR